MNDPFVGSLTFMRVYSGKIEAGSSVSIQLKTKERDLVECFRCTQIQRRYKTAHAGDIIAVAGLKDTTTGDTLCDAENAVILERMDFLIL